jgi:nondiscriminating glutamyl-tRNA synthetase
MFKVRFAPSPTGDLHIGNGRVAVLNYLFARHNKGKFVLRIEDTDVERSEAIFEESIKEDLKWLSIEWDEDPFRQSERVHIYRQQAQQLCDKNLAYKCFCTKEELEKARSDALAHGIQPRYRGTCQNLSPDAIRTLEEKGTPSVLRFRSLEKKIAFKDAIHGEMVFPADHVDDFIIIRSDGLPSYNFAAAVDDRLMEITHVIRGADHLSNTPKQIMLFQAFGAKPPAYGHHSLLTGPDRKPLSKRHGATRVAEFRSLGILPSAMINYLGIAGRKVGKELLTTDALIKGFSLTSFAPSDTIFDLEKLLWLNKEHIRFMDVASLLEHTGIAQNMADKVAVIKENVRTLRDIEPMLAIFDTATVEDDAVAHIAGIGKEGVAALGLLRQALAANIPAGFDDLFVTFQEQTGFARKDELMFLRVVFTGRKNGPPLSELFSMIPKNIILARIECLEQKLSNSSNT